ncbi:MULTISPECIES: hypothetical protein [Hymenobacter]|uniref:Uncharacterized protein n=2 Tax=Hymenobacter TaxID=89966 RepID=A0A328B4M1_9BACT|nr:hypothetical protein [Hymenobacter edaphi]RAK62372.1 hypothetical protein DLM85_23505 [Hymenobacter edaphi]
MPDCTSTALARAYIEPAGSTAELLLLIQFSYQPSIVWEWDFPYLLWNEWGIGKTATWLGEQFRQLDAATFDAVGGEVLRALRQALALHQRYYGAAWLAPARA